MDDGSVCGIHLRAIPLSSTEQQTMLEQVSKLAAQDDAKKQQFENFKKWIARKGPFDVLLDGANIGYSNQRVDKGLCASIQNGLVIILIRCYRSKIAVVSNRPSCTPL